MRARRAGAALAFGVAVAVAGAGCGGGPGGDVASAQMALATSGLQASDIAAVEILVFDGASAGCARVMAGTSPLDDAGLVLEAHALFVIDGSGTPKHMTIAAGKPLDFYAEAFATTAPNRTRIGRGCVTQTLAAGSSAGVTISISAPTE